MRWIAAVVVAVLALVLPGVPATAAAASVPGSTGGPAEPDWSALVARGDRFIYLKATDGTAAVNPDIERQRAEAAERGLLSGGYHFARPDRSSGAAQANLLVDNGGGWSAGALPAALDLEWNPGGSACYGLGRAAMVAWVEDFADTYRARTGRWPVIYTPTTWWAQCTGDLADFGATIPLWATGSLDTLPHGWTTYTFWQATDRDYFNGDHDQLLAFARGT
jgi:GH25 family lysozyme M1 (1,4-beta-N-acetylmuramidase)